MQSDRSAAVVDNECIDQYSPSSALQEPSSTASSGRSSSPRQEEARPWATGPRWAPITPITPIDHRSLTSAGLGLRRPRAPHWSRKVREKEKSPQSVQDGGRRESRHPAPSAAPSSQPALCSHPAPPHSSIPSSSLLQRRAAGRGCLRGRLRSSERRLGERTGVGGTAGGGGPEPQTHSHTPSRSYSHTDTADTHSRSSHQRSQCFQSAAPAHTRTKSWEQKLLQLSASTSGWDHAHTPAAAVWVAEGACHSKGGGAQRRRSVKECGENVSAHVCFWNLETKSTKNFKFLKKAGTDLYARQCARSVALSAKCVVSVLFCVVCCVVTVLFRVTMRVIMNVTKQCKLSPGRNPDCCQGLSPWCSPVSCFYRHT